MPETAELLMRLPVADLTIDEAPIDDIVRKIFTHGHEEVPHRL